MKATLSKRRHPVSSTRRPKRRAARPGRRAHKRHRAAAAATAAAAPLASADEPVPMGGEETNVVFDAVFTDSPDKREEEFSDEELLDREERQDLY
ncbi:MAG: hypothetical protein HYV14_09410 [Elusimicrobia bacterium]|nr:hypothetical protein [Elusimicrobiota bacterium]